MPFADILARGKHYSGIAPVRKRIDNLAGWVCENETVAIISQTVPDFAVFYEHYYSTEVREIDVEVTACSDDGVTSRRKYQGRYRIGRGIVCYLPSSQINRPVGAIQ